MFKQLRFYRLTAASFPNTAVIESALAKSRFSSCGPTEKKSVGWTPPRGNAFDPLLEVIDSQWILRMTVETKAVPGAALRKGVEERCNKIETEEGRKPGRKERKEIKEDVELELLPRAFARTNSTTIWIDRMARTLVIGSTSSGTCDDVVGQLMQNLSDIVPGLAIQFVDTNKSPMGAMSSWLMDHEAPGAFTLDRTLELKASDDTKATVKYARHDLDVGAVREQLAAGLMPINLGLTWSNLVSFVLGADLSIKKITLLDVVEAESEESEVDSFDADVSLMTGTLSGLLPELAKALGGYTEDI